MKNKHIKNSHLKTAGIIASIIGASAICFFLGQEFNANKKMISQGQNTKQLAPDNLNKLINLSANNSLLDNLPIKGKVTHATISYQILTNAIQLDSNDIDSYEISKIKDNYYGVQINLTDNGAQKLSSFTGSHINKPCQFVINNKIISLSMIRSSLGKSFVIPVNSKKKAQDILNNLIK
jgi:preprotein translocase subunit SecD